MTKRLYHKIVKDLFLNNKDLIFNTMGETDLDFRKNYPESMLDDFNSFGFRCDNFIDTHNGKHILFMGCSETQGSNHGLDEAWAYILYKKIKEKESVSGYYNIASIGDGITIQILKLMQYVDNFGVPDEIYFLIPETYRTILYSHKHTADTENSFFLNNIRADENNFTDAEFVNAHGNSVICLRLLESFCSASNTKLFWSTWFGDEEDIFKEYEFKKFISLDIKNMELNIKKIFEQHEDKTKTVKYNLTKNDGHKGLVFHRYWAEKFYEARENEKNNKKS
jgi:hypothetical protein